MIRSAFDLADKIARVSPTASAATRARTRALVIWTALAVPLGIFFILATQARTLASPVAISLFIGCMGLALSFLYLRRSRRLSDASLIFMVSVLAGLGMAAWIDEVPTLLPLIFLAVTPVYFGLMVNWRECLTYTIGLFAFFVALAVWVSIKQNAPPAMVNNIIGCGLAALGSGLSTTAYAYTTELAAKKLKRKTNEIAVLAFNDAMTGLHNRRAFNARITETAPPKPVERVAAIDLDRFKSINDRYGHEIGDEVLSELARRLQAAAPQGADIFRVGGDEFAVIADAARVSSEAFAEALRATSDQPYDLSIGTIPVQISVGVSSPNAASRELKHLYREADIALFEAKKATDLRVCIFSEDLGAAKNREARLTELLKRAIETSQVGTAFQPQFNITENDITGFEALARWQTQDFGAISPGEFIPIADATGLIVALDRCVLKQAIAEAETWLWAEQRLAVNVSGKTLTSPGFVDFVSAAIAESKLAFNQLTIEITETEIIDNKETAKTVCDQLRALGISIALDDFGTGYSSLAYLSTLPINTLKIDRSFVQSARTQSNLKIMKSIIGLANSLGLNLLVEGVERDWQLETVVDLGCDSIQGFYFSRPLTSEQCADLQKRAEFWPRTKRGPVAARA
ncbi:MAG: EAL domain-containing protein [Pseudomonadota bacterium]